MEVDENFDGPKREKMRPVNEWFYGPDMKRLNIHKWLIAHVNQPWDKVYSKFCKMFTNQFERMTFGDRLRGYITFDCYKEDGRVFDSKGEAVYEFYILDGFLRKNRRKDRPRPLTPAERRFKYHGVVWHHEGYFAFIDGLWYELTLAKRKPAPAFDYDAFFKTTTGCISREDSVRVYGRADYFCRDKKQISGEMVKKLNLLGG